MIEDTWKGTLIILLESAKNLSERSDDSCNSDPYCVVTLKANGKQLFKNRTYTVLSNKNPKWKTTYTHYITGSGHAHLKLRVWDENKILKDHLFGKCTYDFVPNSQFRQTITEKLHSHHLHSNKNEEVTFSITFIPEKQIIPRIRIPEEKFVFKNGKHLDLIFGPVLLFHGTDKEKNTYNIDILVVVNGEEGHSPLLTINVHPVDTVTPTCLMKQKNRSLWRYRFAVPRFNVHHSVEYTINENSYQFEVPAIGESVKSVFMSCNGFHDPAIKKELVNEPFHMWKHILINHHKLLETGQGGYNLLIQGGDQGQLLTPTQVYADQVFKLHFLKGKYPGDESVVDIHEVPPEFEEEVNSFFMDLYIESWGGKHIKDALARIPSIMMWDDHDVFDGWGSYPPKLMNCLVYRIIGKVAEKYYCGFQLGCTVEECFEKRSPSALQGDHPGKSQAYKIDRLGIFALDLRSERTLLQVCSQNTYNCFKKWLAENTDIDHLFLILSIPIVYNNFDVLEKAIDRLQIQAEVTDDIKDHWRSEGHQRERLALLKTLIDAAQEHKYRITILSGDVHVGCCGLVYDKHKKNSNATFINCLISSAVVNAPPSSIGVSLLDSTGGELEVLERSNQYHMMAGLIRFMHHPDRRRYVPHRNFLELITDEKNGVHCNWYMETDENNPTSLYIYPYEEGIRKKADSKLWKNEDKDFNFVRAIDHLIDYLL